jgi:hypothetical protein
MHNGSMFLFRVKIDQVVIMTLKLGVTFVTFPPIYFQLIFVLSLSDSSNSGIREFKQKKRRIETTEIKIRLGLQTKGVQHNPT